MLPIRLKSIVGINCGRTSNRFGPSASQPGPIWYHYIYILSQQTIYTFSSRFQCFSWQKLLFWAQFLSFILFVFKFFVHARLKKIASDLASDLTSELYITSQGMKCAVIAARLGSRKLHKSSNGTFYPEWCIMLFIARDEKH